MQHICKFISSSFHLTSVGDTLQQTICNNETGVRVNNARHGHRFGFVWVYLVCVVDQGRCAIRQIKYCGMILHTHLLCMSQPGKVLSIYKKDGEGYLRLYIAYHTHHRRSMVRLGMRWVGFCFVFCECRTVFTSRPIANSCCSEHKQKNLEPRTSHPTHRMIIESIYCAVQCCPCFLSIVSRFLSFGACPMSMFRSVALGWPHFHPQIPHTKSSFIPLCKESA